MEKMDIIEEMEATEVVKVYGDLKGNGGDSTDGRCSAVCVARIDVDLISSSQSCCFSQRSLHSCSSISVIVSLYTRNRKFANSLASLISSFVGLYNKLKLMVILRQVT